jgi:D-serine deaminase-like pyridoxal phosphate-dependent protein
MKKLASDADVANLETPVVLVDRRVLERNLARASAIARSAGVALRPHAKTHKSLALARRQVELGAIGLTVAKTSEALTFLAGGVGDVTVAHPLLDRRKIGRLIEAGRTQGAAVRVICDSAVGVEALGSTAAELGAVLDVLVKVDVGLHRCGVDPSGSDALDLARRIEEHRALCFGGLVSHAGHAYRAEDLAAVRRVAEEERQTMVAMTERLAAKGIAVPCVSVGSTPTVWAAERFDGVTEIRPGNYIFMDLTQVSLGIAGRDELALSVLATVVSVNRSFAIIDAGSKVLSSDRGPHGSSRLAGYGIAASLAEPDDEMTVVSLSEEHGFIAHEGRPLTIGERLRIWPNHACTVANLSRDLTLVEHRSVAGRLRVDAAACTA